MSLAEALTASLGGLDTKPQDQAAVALARLYAEQVDADPAALVKVGPLLLAALESLAMTPRGRAAVLGKGAASDKPGADAKHPDDCKCLPCKRSRRASRVDSAAAVDSSAS